MSPLELTGDPQPQKRNVPHGKLPGAECFLLPPLIFYVCELYWQIKCIKKDTMGRRTCITPESLHLQLSSSGPCTQNDAGIFPLDRNMESDNRKLDDLGSFVSVMGFQLNSLRNQITLAPCSEGLLSH